MGTSSKRRSRRAAATVVAGLVLGAVLSGISVPGASGKTQPRVLYVFPAGQPFANVTPSSLTFSSIQAAVNAAHKGDWILIAPGDYHETDDVANPPSKTDLATGWYGGVDITTPGIHLRGMDRNTVVVDGTRPGSPQCSSAPGDQNTLGGDGQNGIIVWRANKVSVDNLTVCNYLAGTKSNTSAGNEVWWNGGPNPARPGITSYEGSYLTATSTYFVADGPTTDEPNPPANQCSVCALYGIFSSHAKGPATLSQLYANNMSDSGMYIGACLQLCNVTVNGAWMENNALGYSGTNSGGQIVVENSTFDNNKDGFDTNTALTGDPPPPQNGQCPNGTISPITGTTRCWVVMNNTFSDNNNPDVPVSGTAGLGPTGTGMTVSGGRFDTVTNNKFVGNGAWGILFVPYPDGNLGPSKSTDHKTCLGEGGINVSSYGIKGLNCLLDPWGNLLQNNEFSGNGTFPGNPDGADFGNLVGGGGEPVNCFVGNTEWDPTFSTQTGSATDANVIDDSPTGHGQGQTPSSSCTANTPTVGFALIGNNTDQTLLVQVECDAGVLSGPTDCGTANYPQPTPSAMTTLAAGGMYRLPTLPSMPNPCQGVPSNVWCPGGTPAATPQR